MEVERLRQREVHLDGGELPVAADRVGEMEVDLRAVERALALRHGVRLAPLVERALERLGGFGPHLLVADRLAGLCRELDARLAEPERLVDVEGQLHHADDLVDELVAPAEDVRVVLGETAHAQHAVQHA